MEKLEHLNGLLAEIEYLKEARDLLYAYYVESNPYDGSGISRKTHKAILEFFHFDDSE